MLGRFSIPLVLVVLVISCVGNDPSLTQPEPEDDAGTSTPSVDASSGDARTDDDASSGPDPIPQPEGCTAKTVDETKGIFVESSGTDASSCGSLTDPCKSITQGLARAKTIAGRTIVYVARGTYVEQVVPVSGIAIEGGWDFLKPNWQPICTDIAHDAVKIVAPADKNVTVLADAIGGDATLRVLTVQSKAEDQVLPGESIYGIFARGPTTKVVLDTVAVDLVRGGSGAVGTAGNTGSAAGGGCAAGNGSTGGTGSVGGGGQSGSIGSDGYVPGDGASIGTTGDKGSNGTGGGQGQCLNTCVVGCVPTGVGGTCSTTSGKECGGTGTSGCGGGGGTGGGVGHGGGSSIAVFSYEANVEINRSSLSPGNGGSGGAGGSGGEGGGGGGGAAGASGTCHSGCQSCQPSGGSTLSGGSAGGMGGKGGQGGQGGGGAGGWSFAIIEGASTGKITTDAATSLKMGLPGAGGAAGGATGQAGTTWSP